MAEVNKAGLTKHIEALKNGDRGAFTHIYHSFGPKLYGFTRKLVPDQEEAAEIVQEVFVKLWERKHFLDPAQHFDGYLFRMARNIVYNKARRQVHACAYNRYRASKENQTENETEHRMDYQDLNQALEETYAAFPPVRRQVFLMSRIEGLSNGEIAQELQTSNSNIENHINKALRDIRVKLKSFRIIYFLVLSCFPFT
jgi:RNA polymerase sigma-70 factor (ECF subfamily)